MGIVSVLMRSDETAVMKDSEVLGNRALRNFKMAGKGVYTEGFVIPKKGDYPESAFNTKHTHKLSHLLKRMNFGFHRTPFQYISIY